MFMDCPYCSSNGVPLLEAVPLQGQTVKTGFHIKASCGECGRYLKFMSQTPEVLEQLDRQNEFKKKLL